MNCAICGVPTVGADVKHCSFCEDMVDCKDLAGLAPHIQTCLLFAGSSEREYNTTYRRAWIHRWLWCKERSLTLPLKEAGDAAV